MSGNNKAVSEKKIYRYLKIIIDGVQVRFSGKFYEIAGNDCGSY